jgi:hypothetical protein
MFRGFSIQNSAFRLPPMAAMQKTTGATNRCVRLKADRFAAPEIKGSREFYFFTVDSRRLRTPLNFCRGFRLICGVRKQKPCNKSTEKFKKGL